MTEELYTVEAAAERLKLHKKTLLRYLRERRLRATKIGNQYRILRSDLDAFAGVDAAVDAGAGPARVTTVVEVADVDQDLLRRLTSTLLGAGGGSSEQRADAMSIDIAHNPVRRTVKVIAVGTPLDVAALLKIVDACLGA
jgi:excisionase family DNA binding protein